MLAVGSAVWTLGREGNSLGLMKTAQALGAARLLMGLLCTRDVTLTNNSHDAGPFAPSR